MGGVFHNPLPHPRQGGSSSNELVMTSSLTGNTLCSAEVLMGVPSGASSRPPCASKLCGPVPKYEFREEGGDFLGWLALQHIRGIEFYVHQVLVYHVSGGTERI